VNLLGALIPPRKRPTLLFLDSGRPSSPMIWLAVAVGLASRYFLIFALSLLVSLATGITPIKHGVRDLNVKKVFFLEPVLWRLSKAARILGRVLEDLIPLALGLVKTETPAEFVLKRLGEKTEAKPPKHESEEPCEACALGSLLDAETFYEEALKRSGGERRRRVREFVRAVRHAEGHLAEKHGDLAREARDLRKKLELCMFTECEMPRLKGDLEALMDKIADRAPLGEIEKYLEGFKEK